MPSKPTWARGVSRQIGFKKLLGEKQRHARGEADDSAGRKEDVRAVTPAGRILLSLDICRLRSVSAMLEF